MTSPTAPLIAIACGGTGGHLFPGLAVAERLVRRGCAVTLLISPKEVDQEAVKTASGMEIVTLPAVGLSRGRAIAFVRGFFRSYRAVKRLFRARPPQAALAMGGFTSAPAVLAARSLGARTFLHESNTVPGRANRWLARVVDQVFVGFPQTAARFDHPRVMVTGTPVRPQFQPRDPHVCRIALGLDPARPVLLVMGGSQGASGINDLVIHSLPLLAKAAPQLQLLHLAGPNDAERIDRACSALKVKAIIYSFFAEMDLALGAATVAVSRAGASSLAELAAMGVPAVLVPYPAATDNHQLSNARAYVETGAAHLIEQNGATPETLALLVLDLLENAGARQKMQAALEKWHDSRASEQIADAILGAVFRNASGPVLGNEGGSETGERTAPRDGAAETHNASAA